MELGEVCVPIIFRFYYWVGKFDAFYPALAASPTFIQVAALAENHFPLVGQALLSLGRPLAA